MDFSQPSEDVNAGVSLVAKKLLEHGVTSFCPTLVTSPPSVYHQVPPALPHNHTRTNLMWCVVLKVLPQIRVHGGGADGAAVLGTRTDFTFSVSPENPDVSPGP